MTVKRIDIRFTPEQTEQLRPFVEVIREAYDNECPGILIGQAYSLDAGGDITEGAFSFIEHMTARAVIAVMELGEQGQQEEPHP